MHVQFTASTQLHAAGEVGIDVVHRRDGTAEQLAKRFQLLPKLILGPEVVLDDGHCFRRF